ncbi:DUF2510 domain-containing protein [Nitriliruptoraceae bacterium ZYF776]|nr:DUF2510 domain-containing protein [Profundirhabdus halotolerans]
MSDAPPGWYPDPNDPASTRWWNGSAWADPPPPPPPAGPGGVPAPSVPSTPPHGAAGSTATAAPGPLARWATIGGAAAVVVGAFLPWLTLNAPFVGSMSVAGIEGDGVLTLLVALAAAGVAAPLFKDERLVRWRSLTTAVCGAVITVIAVVAAVGVRDATTVLEFGQIGRIGIGLWLTMLAGACASAGALASAARTPTGATSGGRTPGA